MMKFLKKLIIFICLCSCLFVYACKENEILDGDKNNGGSQIETQLPNENQNENNNENQNENNNENQNENNNENQNENNNENQNENNNENQNENNNENQNENNNENQNENNNENQNENNNENVNENQNDNDINQDSEIDEDIDLGMTIEQKNYAYNILKNLSLNNIYDTTKDNQTHTTYSQYYGYEFDITNTGLTQEEWDTYYNQTGISIIPISKIKENTIIAGRNIQGEGYRNYLSVNATNNLKIEESKEIVKYDQSLDKFLRYALVDKYGSWTYIVDNDYAKNVCTYDFYNEPYGVTELIKVFARTQNYSDLNTLVVNSIKDAMLDAKNDLLKIMWNNYSVNIDIKQEDNYYVLIINLTYLEQTDTTPSYQTEVYGIYEFAFDEKGILKIDVKNGYNQLSSTMEYYYLQYYFDQTDLNKEFVEENKLYTYLKKYYELSIDFTQSFDASYLQADTSDCGGQYLYNHSFQNTVIYLDLEITDTVYATFGNIISINKFPNTNCQLYWDKECLEPIENDATYFSYQKPIYVKTQPKQGYAMVRYLHRDLYGYSLEQAGSFRKGAIEYNLKDNAIYPIEPAPLMHKVVKVIVDGLEVIDFANGITLTENKIYYIDIYSDYDW